MTRELLLERLIALKAKGIEIILTSDSEYLSISSEKLLSQDNIIIKDTNTLNEIGIMIERFEDKIERSNNSSLFDFLNTNLNGN